MNETTQPKREIDPILIASNTSPGSAAGSIAGAVRDRGKCRVRAIGAGAVNQATKAVAAAIGFLAVEGISAVCTINFVDVPISDRRVTALVWSLWTEGRAS